VSEKKVAAGSVECERTGFIESPKVALHHCWVASMLAHVLCFSFPRGHPRRQVLVKKTIFSKKPKTKLEWSP